MPQAPDVSVSRYQEAVHVVLVEVAGQQQLPAGVGQMALQVAGEGGQRHLTTGKTGPQQLTQHEIQAAIKAAPIAAHQLGRMGDFAEADTLGRRAAAGLTELGPEAMAEAMGIIEAKASAALPQPMDGGGNQVFAHLGLLAIEFQLVGLVEKTAVIVGPGAKAQPGAGGGIGRQQGLLEGRMLIRNMVGDEIQHDPQAPLPAAAH